MPDLIARIAENVTRVRQRIAEAAVRSGRSAKDIALVAVTKSASIPEIRALAAAECHDFGESRPQQLWDRAAELADLPIRWHMIGHFQRNKVRRTVPLLAMIHSVDSQRLAETIHMEIQTSDVPVACRPLPVLLEVNTSGEEAKGGLQPNEVEPFLTVMAGYRNLAVRGLMCMASLEGGLDAARRNFAALRELRDRLRNNCPTGVSLDELSMGMSGDFEVAIEEGATIVRVGSALFE
jgi:pyridoxal phosphate enzyme (YggS family)